MSAAVTRDDLINRIASTMQEDTSTKPFETLEDFERDNLRDWAKSALAAIEEAGCKVVPAEPLVYQPVNEVPPPRNGTWFLLRGRNAANQPIIPVVVSWCSFRAGEEKAFRDSATLSDMNRIITDVPDGSSADWCALPETESNK